jgi:hypothetical protein
METYIYEVKSAKGVLLEQLYQEIILISNGYKHEEEPAKIRPIPSLNSVLLTTTNHKLVSALSYDEDFTITKIQ